MRFHVIDEAEVITQTNGIYRQVKMYYRTSAGEHLVYARHGTGFIRLSRNNATSVPHVRWEETDLKPKFNKLGRMTL